MYRALGVASLCYLLAGTWWAFGDTGFPFGPGHDPNGSKQSPLGSVTHDEAWPYVVALGLVGVLTALGLARAGSRWWARSAVAAAVLLGLLCAVVLPDGRPLIATAHVPVLLAGKPFGWPGDVTIASQVPWPVVHQLLLLVLGAGWLAAALRAARRHRGACVACGRTSGRSRWATPDAALRWGRWAVGVAIVVPTAYASSRIAWALDLPFGVTREWMADLRADEPTIFVAGAAMALLGLGGATLTFGLVARWGERWPRWVPGLAGREVPPRVGLVPSMVVAGLLVSAGKGWYWSAISGRLPEQVLGENWATVVFGAFLPVWGVALGLAGYAYWLRRRGRCRRCGRGSGRSEREDDADPPACAVRPGGEATAERLDPSAGVP